MKKINILAVLFVAVFISQSAFATVFTNKFLKCSPYIQDEGNKLVQVVGYMNRTCVYRELTLEENTQCAFNREQRALINQELRLRGYSDISLKNLQTFQKFAGDNNICSVNKKDEVRAK